MARYSNPMPHDVRVPEFNESAEHYVARRTHRPELAWRYDAPVRSEFGTNADEYSAHRVNDGGDW